MTDDAFERELICAFRGLISSIATLAQRAAVQAVRSALVGVSHPESELRNAMTAVGTRSRPVPSLSRPTLTPRARAEVLARTLAVIRQHPGSTTARLAKVLGLRIDPMKRHLKKLADDGAVRIEMRQVGGVPRRAYFAGEQVVNGRADGGPIAPAEATA